MKKLLTSIVLLLSITGCTQIPIAEKDNGDLQKVTSFEASEKYGVMYLYRDRTSDYPAHEFEIAIGDEDVSTWSSCYKRVELEPGMYHLEANHYDTFGFEDERDYLAVAGQVDFFEYKPILRFGVPGETKIIPKTREEAVEIIKKQQLCPNPPAFVKLSD
ncbi:MAG: hypothetical protein R3207_03600 [Oceanospirillum sp.]|nr:hypothetical protein [Oceanospirillum sp.]